MGVGTARRSAAASSHWQHAGVLPVCHRGTSRAFQKARHIGNTCWPPARPPVAAGAGRWSGRDSDVASARLSLLRDSLGGDPAHRGTGRLPGQGRLGVVGPSPRRDSITCSHCDGAQPHCGTVTARQYNLKPAAAAGPGGPAPAPETPCVTLATRVPRVTPLKHYSVSCSAL
jgi:hypothetical protein